MPNEIQKVDQSFTPAQLELMKRTIAKGATPDELALFVGYCKRTGLDPFVRQIHFVKRGDKATFQVGIDGLRTIAERSGQYAGNDDPVYEYDEKSKSKYPVKSTVTVYKLVGSEKCAFKASARWDEYVPIYNGQIGTMWAKMPHTMLGKVAESLALRKAFPNDLSGLYSREEMAQADNSASVPAKQPKHATEEQLEDEERVIDIEDDIKAEEIPQ